MRIANLVTILAASLALAACGSGENAADMNDMPMNDDQMAMDGDAMLTASTEGTVTAIDAETGTITIDHGAVPAVEWPAMTMAFEANDIQRTSVAVGDEVTFTFEMTANGGRIDSITKR